LFELPAIPVFCEAPALKASISASFLGILVLRNWRDRLAAATGPNFELDKLEISVN
jgi:hypothetical protein